MEGLDVSDVRFFSGTSRPQLAADIASYLSVPLDETTIGRLSNDKLTVQLGVSVRGRGTYLVQS